MFFRCFFLVEFTVDQLFDWSGSFSCFLPVISFSELVKTESWSGGGGVGQIIFDVLTAIAIHLHTAFYLPLHPVLNLITLSVYIPVHTHKRIKTPTLHGSLPVHNIILLPLPECSDIILPHHKIETVFLRQIQVVQYL